MLEIVGARAIYLFGEGCDPNLLAFLEFSLHSFSTTFAFIIGRCTLMRSIYTQHKKEFSIVPTAPDEIVHVRGQGRLI